MIAAVSIVVALGLASMVGQAFELSFFIVNMVVAMGLALGIDYSLFVVSRYREERYAGLAKHDAIAVSGATASKAVLFSGSAFVVALLGMLLVPDTVLRSLATGAVLVGIVTVASALTLLPGDPVAARRPHRTAAHPVPAPPARWREPVLDARRPGRHPPPRLDRGCDHRGVARARTAGAHPGDGLGRPHVLAGRHGRTPGLRRAGDLLPRRCAEQPGRGRGRWGRLESRGPRRRPALPRPDGRGRVLRCVDAVDRARGRTHPGRDRAHRRHGRVGGECGDRRLA